MLGRSDWATDYANGGKVLRLIGNSLQVWEWQNGEYSSFHHRVQQRKWVNGSDVTEISIMGEYFHDTLESLCNPNTALKFFQHLRRDRSVFED